MENLGNREGWDWKIISTDLSSRMLKIAEAGIYAKERIQSIPLLLVKKYFLKGDLHWKDYIKIKEQIKRYLCFQRLNLIEPFSFPEPFDCIFCRNVMIYFDRQTQASLVNRFYQNLNQGGILFIGHSESLTGIPHKFRYIKPAIYQKEV